MAKNRYLKNPSGRVMKYNPEEHNIERLKQKKYIECDRNGKALSGKKTAKKNKK